jgi:hypothetical protein
MVRIFKVYATIFLFTLYVSTLMGLHRVLSVAYHLALKYNAIFVHVQLHIYVIIGLSRFSFTPLGMPLNDKVNIAFILLH